MAKKNNDKKNQTNEMDTVAIAEKQRLRHLLQKINADKSLSKAELDEFRILNEKYMSTSNGNIDKGHVAIAIDEVITTQAAAARYIGVNIRTIRRWISAGMLRTEHKHYIKSQLEIFKLNTGQAQSEDRDREIKAKADVREVQAKILDLDLGSRLEKYHDAEECLQRDIVRILTVKRALMGMGRKIAQRLPKKQRRKVQAEINAEARTICTNFADGRI